MDARFTGTIPGRGGILACVPDNCRSVVPCGGAWVDAGEGKTLVDLFGVRGVNLLRELTWTPAYLPAVSLGGVLASLITRLIYGSAATRFLSIVDLPPAGALYAFLIWPPISSVTEELVCLGYFFPRVDASTGKTWAAVVLVTFFCGIEHMANPFIADGT